MHLFFASQFVRLFSLSSQHSYWNNFNATSKVENYYSYSRIFKFFPVTKIKIIVAFYCTRVVVRYEGFKSHNLRSIFHTSFYLFHFQIIMWAKFTYCINSSGCIRQKLWNSYTILKFTMVVVQWLVFIIVNWRAILFIKSKFESSLRTKIVCHIFLKSIYMYMWI